VVASCARNDVRRVPNQAGLQLRVISEETGKERHKSSLLGWRRPVKRKDKTKLR
jgi:hypothetical protein